ncbi:hypothetical protein [Methanogenium organophilum]|uniref:Uncharacterized protein n=1 Tax=Methanogenium organophilum TaxID=2199 RepID=A0A9X9S4R3_METOG|nr:hypothetical protein [Methanogenium organophilum]WAI01924.1 hypothetical protein OU421_03385 [Methanogenium organophilum]
MDIRQAAAVALAGVVLFIYLSIIGQYAASIAVMIILIIGMTIYMTRLGKIIGDIPELTAKLSPDAKSVIIRNSGNTSAVQIHVALVPLDIEYDITEIPAEEEHTHSLDTMINEAKAFITWKDSEGHTFSHESAISALGKGEDDLLKPMFPMFDIKK